VSDVLRLLDKAGMQSIQEFDDRFGGTQSLFDWIQDLETELWNAGLEEQSFLTARIALCEEALRRFGSDDELMTENWRRALAGSYFELGETTHAEALYRDWLKADPGWGWGWIGWSDGYRFTRTERQDFERCEQILREGLSIADVRDRPDLADRLADLCEEQGRHEEAEDWWQQAKESEPPIETTLEALPDGAKRRGSRLERKDCRSVSCPTTAPRSGRIPRPPPSSSQRSGETSHALAGAARNSRNAAAGVRRVPDRLLRIVAG